MPLKTNGLTPKQEAYALARASGLTQLRAYRRAFNSNGSASTANRGAARLERKPMVRMRIQELTAPAVNAVAERVTQELTATLGGVLSRNADIVNADIRDLLSPDGAIKPPSEWPDSAARAVASYKTTPGKYGDAVQVTLNERGAAIDRHLRVMGGYEKDKDKRDPTAELLDGVPRDVLKKLRDALREHLSSTGSVVSTQPARK